MRADLLNHDSGLRVLLLSVQVNSCTWSSRGSPSLLSIQGEESDEDRVVELVLQLDLQAG
jgi:hypothetical protein